MCFFFFSGQVFDTQNQRVGFASTYVLFIFSPFSQNLKLNTEITQRNTHNHEMTRSGIVHAYGYEYDQSLMRHEMYVEIPNNSYGYDIFVQSYPSKNIQNHKFLCTLDCIIKFVLGTCMMQHWSMGKLGTIDSIEKNAFTIPLAMITYSRVSNGLYLHQGTYIAGNRISNER
jgi:hypothetical protein